LRQILEFFAITIFNTLTKILLEMLNEIVVFLLITFSILFSCNNPNLLNQRDIVVDSNVEIEFFETEHDFGSLYSKNEAVHKFEFKNTGTAPLVIYNVTATCGCTVPEWTKKPVKPDEKGTITITYDTNYNGAFRKTISVYHNGKESPHS